MARRRRHQAFVAIGALATLWWAVGPVSAGAPDPSAADAQPVVPAIGADLLDQNGPVDVVLRLSRPALAETVAPNATVNGGLPDPSAQRATIKSAEDQQHTVLNAATRLGAEELGAVSRSLNAVVLHVDAATVPALAAIPGVTDIHRMPSYTLAWPRDTPVASGSLAQAIRYLEIDRIRDQGIDGTGVRVATIDSGVDFTHANLGGPGTPADYTKCYGTPPGPGVSEEGQPRNAAPTGTCAKLFGPDAPKVIGGYDFVGESWPSGPVVPDPNPIDFQGHGTHVADILAGASADGKHLGLAPGAKLYAYKACSARATSCNGAAVLEAIDRALDPNQDGNMDDAVDVINMSLGAFYGQPGAADVFAVANAVRAGVVVAVAAGNDGNKPWIVGRPSIAPGAIAVAETALPDASLLPVQVVSPPIEGLTDNTIRYAVPQTWSPAPTEPVEGQLTVPAGEVGPAGAPPSQGCDPSNFTNFDDSVARIALIDRGSCDASVVVSNAEAAGALAVILVDDRVEVPPSLNAGQGTPGVPAVFIAGDKGDLLKGALARDDVQVRLDPTDRISLANTMADTSSRGPAQAAGAVKPDIAAPGAWTSAIAGSGSAERAFSGTSGATPVVAAAAALLRQAYPDEDPGTIKQRLIGSADTDNRTVDVDGNMYPTPITRVGGGEVRPFAALRSRTQVGDPSNGDGNLSFGVQAAAGRKFVLKRITIRNSSDELLRYHIHPAFRQASDARTRAVTLFAPPVVAVPAGERVTIPVVFVINAERLPAWAYYDRAQDLALAGANGDDGHFLDGPEFDGYLTVRANGDDKATLGWQALPKRSAAVVARSKDVQLAPDGTAPLEFRNVGVEDGVVDAFSLTGSSDRLPTRPAPPPGTPVSSEAVIDLANVGVRDLRDSLQFGVTQFGRRPTPQVPALIEIDLDTNGDGVFDHVVFNDDFNGFKPTDGRAFVFGGPRAGPFTRFGPVDADVNSANEIFTAPLSALGLVPGQTFTFRVRAFDRYFTGNLEDTIDGMSYTVGHPRFTVAGGATFAVPAHTPSAATTVQADATGGPSSETGLLLLYRVNDGSESTAVTVAPSAAP